MLFGEFPEKENLETCSNLELDTIGSINGLNWSANNKKAWNIVSSGFQSLINRMLSINPEERPSISEILEWDWVQFDWCEQFIQDVFEEMEQRKEFWESMKLQQNKVHQL